MGSDTPTSFQLAYLTPDLPGIGGVIKQRPEDFFVQEQPIDELTGQGEHLALYIEKRQWTTTDVIRRLAKVFRISRGDIGYAGLKDKYAITQQMFTVTFPDPSNDQLILPRVDHPHVKILWTKRHSRKLRRGHSAGNRFVIRIRGVDASAAVSAKRILDRLAVTGVPNYVGQQRFGYRRTNHVLGRLLLQRQWEQFLDLMLGDPRDSDHPPTRAGREAYVRGDYDLALQHWPRHLRHDRQALDALRQGKDAQAAVLAIDRQQRDFLVSSFQSVAFNHVLDQRIRKGLINQLIEGDLAWKHDSRAVFSVDGATAELENGPGGRVEAIQLSPSGPMWGMGMPRAGGIVDQWESQALMRWGLTEADLMGGPQASSEGQRRPLRYACRETTVAGGIDEHGQYVQVAFLLPPGSFATIVLREIMKTDDPQLQP